MARRGLAMILGPRHAYLPQIWVDDAAAAVVAALRDAPAGIYNVVDDEPLTRGDVAGVMALAVGRRRLFVPPILVARLITGRHVLPLTRSQRVSNRRFKETTGWAPRVPNAREGWGLIAAHQRY